MNTPICDFLESYASNEYRRFHMPGHKGKGEGTLTDLTEVDGLDGLYTEKGVIFESEQNASSLFGSLRTCYSVEGSSQCVRAMLHLAKLCKNPDTRGYILATRNAHSSLITASFLLDFDIEWIFPSEGDSYVSCLCTPQMIDGFLCSAEKKPFAVYLTSPDYLGNIADIKGISQVCKRHGVLLLVDNAHGAYLKFSDTLLHPLDLGADMCCDSAHKTLPVLTGGAYLHIGRFVNDDKRDILCKNVKSVMLFYGSTSPSFLILSSLDKLNKEIAHGDLVSRQNAVENAVLELKKRLDVYGFELLGNESLKISIRATSYGYTGTELASKLKSQGIFVEFFDNDFVVLMLSCNTSLDDIEFLENALLSIPKRDKITHSTPPICKPVRAMSVRKAGFCAKERIHVDNSLGRVFASFTVSCPPAVAILACGEIIDQGAIDVLKYYGTEYIDVIVC